jgi:hypothetical protein
MEIEISPEDAAVIAGRKHQCEVLENATELSGKLGVSFTITDLTFILR